MQSSLNEFTKLTFLQGSRGIGKTSIARIFAKVIRCEKIHEENGMLRSCDQCSSCKEIAASNSVDVIEIDGASNNGVEAVREIRENAKYMPFWVTARYYIIDEVHMLTTAAFNALLKTLEEPPSHVIFIFATTEPHKIPATILSRCQRFDYRRVTLSQIQTRLAEIAEKEEIQVEAGAFTLISRAAEGSMRDALSLFDQVIAFSGTQISLQNVRESIGLVEGQTLVGILSGVFSRKPLDALKYVEQAYQQGHDLRVLTRSLIEFLHATLLAKIGSADSCALELSEEEWKEIQAISALRSIEEIELFFQVLHQGLEWIARSPQPKIVLDILLIKCATADALVYVSSQASSPPSAVSSQLKAGTNSETSSPLSAGNPPLKAATQPEASPQPSTISPQIKASTQPVAGIQPNASVPALAISSEQKTDNLPSWEGFIEHVRKSRPLLASILEHSSGTKVPPPQAPPAERVITISFSSQEAYFREQLQSRIYQEQLTNLSKEYLGFAVQLRIEIKQSGES